MGQFDASADAGRWGAPDSMEREARDPGWYRDPAHPRLHRYWDGFAWHPQALPMHLSDRRGAPLPQPRQGNE